MKWMFGVGLAVIACLGTEGAAGADERMNIVGAPLSIVLPDEFKQEYLGFDTPDFANELMIMLLEPIEGDFTKVLMTPGGLDQYFSDSNKILRGPEIETVGGQESVVLEYEYPDDLGYKGWMAFIGVDPTVALNFIQSTDPDGPPRFTRELVLAALSSLRWGDEASFAEQLAVAGFEVTPKAPFLVTSMSGHRTIVLATTAENVASSEGIRIEIAALGGFLRSVQLGSGEPASEGQEAIFAGVSGLRDQGEDGGVAYVKYTADTEDLTITLTASGPTGAFTPELIAIIDGIAASVTPARQ